MNPNAQPIISQSCKSIMSDNTFTGASSKSMIYNNHLTLLEHELHSDVTFSVGQEEELIKAHKCILAASSPAFESVFANNSDEIIRIPDVVSSAFKGLIRYIYIEEILIDGDNWAPILYASMKYDIPFLTKMCKSYVHDKCSSTNACLFYCQGWKHNVLPHIIEKINSRILLNALDSFSSDSFLAIDNNAMLKDIISSDKLDCDEVEIFKGALRWASAKIQDQDKSSSMIREILGPALFAIRLPRLSANVFAHQVVQTGILKDEEILDVLKKIAKCSGDPISFSSHSRVRSCVTHSLNATKETTVNYLIIVFNVDKPVRIDGFGINSPSDKESILEGKIFLKSVDQDTIFGESLFQVCFSESFKLSAIYFDNPVSIHHKTQYVATIEFNSNVTMPTGTLVKSTEIVDGVTWRFETSKEDGLDGGVGLIPRIYFNQLE